MNPSSNVTTSNISADSHSDSTFTNRTDDPIDGAFLIVWLFLIVLFGIIFFSIASSYFADTHKRKARSMIEHNQYTQVNADVVENWLRANADGERKTYHLIVQYWAPVHSVLTATTTATTTTQSQSSVKIQKILRGINKEQWRKSVLERQITLKVLHNYPLSGQPELFDNYKDSKRQLGCCFFVLLFCITPFFFFGLVAVKGQRWFSMIFFGCFLLVQCVLAFIAWCARPKSLEVYIDEVYSKGAKVIAIKEQTSPPETTTTTTTTTLSTMMQLIRQLMDDTDETNDIFTIRPEW
eukprot:CAMPEP_0202477124 /NCGR_PEP_ID=MMETSP1360-20130828/93675_1 /ASSEMBLY_ACC=CAM_ASM_000848 /TAXON_ID=515479 /ORGANISM="Licmophora paradoxa, Strain CCMP2313" /LENGTH=294 /DNA_ID=CAMNT_0049104359 /DNA_START=511 /DNA_END=1392 /DNA_ORIENTATION=-